MILNRDLEISIIIPCKNEEENLSQLLPYLNNNSGMESMEIIVVNANDCTTTQKICVNNNATYIVSNKAQRATQLNLGAKNARNSILYFLHADAIPPKDFHDHIIQSIKKGYQMGIFSMKFDSDHPMLKINERFNKKDNLFTGGGDQSLFIKAENFHSLGGYDESHLIMEDFEFYKRARQKLNNIIIPDDLIISARKYENNSYLKVQIANFFVFFGYKLGLSQQFLKNFYSKTLS